MPFGFLNIAISKNNGVEHYNYIGYPVNASCLQARAASLQSRCR